MAKKPTDTDRARTAAGEFYQNLNASVRCTVRFVHVRQVGSLLECTAGIAGGTYMPAGYIFFPDDLGAL